MAYTHYWKMPNKELSEQAVSDLNDVLERHSNIIDVKPIVSNDLIVFNGAGEKGYETLYVELGESGFCKTNRKEYDIAVCESLLVLQHHLGDEFELNSDGFHVDKENFESKKLDGTWTEAVENVKEHYDMEFNLNPNIKFDRGSANHFSFELEPRKLTYNHVKEVYGNEQDGESPYFISRLGDNFSEGVISYGHNEEAALERLSNNLPFPADINYVQFKEVEQDFAVGSRQHLRSKSEVQKDNDFEV